jgi:probable rRNA maturation factor
MAFVFTYHKVKFKLDKTAPIKKWIEAIAKTEKKTVGGINYVFVSDKEILRLNKQYLKHNSYTDIITFDYTEGKAISGDIFISVDRVKENAKKFKVKFEDELHRVMIHGVLHLCGYKDKTPKDSKEMRKKEDFSLNKRGF